MGTAYGSSNFSIGNLRIITKVFKLNYINRPSGGFLLLGENMEYFTNHCWCSKSNWDNYFFDSPHIVTIDEKYDGEDYDKLIEEVEMFDKESYQFHKEYMEKHFKGTTVKEGMFYKTSKQLRLEVFDWLLSNVLDNKEGKTWCVGNLDYCSTSYAKSYTIFFKRRKDAFAFVKKWSKYKKFTSQINYFKDTRKTLDFKTNRYSHSER